MDAFFAKNRLSAYLDGSLSEGEANELEQALASDPSLRAEYEAMKRAVGLMREQGPVRAPPDLHAKIMARVASEPMPGGTLHWLRRPFDRLPMEGLALAAAALLVVLAIQWKPDAPQTPPPPEAESVASAPVEPPAKEGQEELAMAPPSNGDAAPKSLTLGRTLPVPGTSKLSGPVSTGTTPPEEPFLSDWEKAEKTSISASTTEATPTSQPTAESKVGLDEALTRGVEQRTALYYQLTTNDASTLATLASIAERAGGKLVSSKGEAVAPDALNDETNFGSFSLVIPPGKLKEVTDALRKMGAQVSTPPASGPLHPAEQVILNLEILYRP